MAVLHGHAGKVVVAAADVTEVNDWSMDIDPGLVENTAFGATSKTFVPTLTTANGSFSCKFDSADTAGHVVLNAAAIAGTPVALKFYISAANYYTLSAAYVKLGQKATANGLIEATYSFTSSSLVTYT
jgi:hypothetical protein